MIYAITGDHFTRYIHHKAYAGLEARALAAVKSSAEDVKGSSWAEILGVEEQIAPKSLLRVEGSDGLIDVTGILLPEPDAVFAFFEIAQTSYRDIALSIDAAEQDANVERVVLNFNTPGGYVSGVEAIAGKIANASKATVSRVGDMAASAGYWLASQADTIEATAETSSVGSIGVVVDTLDFSGWEEMNGVKALHITNRESSDKRPDLSTEHGVEVLQDELDQIYEVFRDAVVTGRTGHSGFTAETVGDLRGRVVAARRAEDLGLVDSISINQQQEADTMAGEENTPEVVAEPSATNAEPVAAPAPAAVEPAPDLVAEAVAAERARVSGLLALGGVQMSATLTTAIQEGTTKADYAVAALEAQNKAPEATQQIPAIPSAHKKEEANPQASEEKAEEKFSSVIDSIAPKINK